MTQPPLLMLPAELAQSIHDYLITRPMREVEHLVLTLRQAKPVEAKDEQP
jgi:hypothetical protein